MAYCFTCQNLGTVECLCGGDLCCCLYRGEKPCPTCGGFPLAVDDFDDFDDEDTDQ